MKYFFNIEYDKKFDYGYGWYKWIEKCFNFMRVKKLLLIRV